jgi:hypothetical protein
MTNDIEIARELIKAIRVLIDKGMVNAEAQRSTAEDLKATFASVDELRKRLLGPPWN